MIAIARALPTRAVTLIVLVTAPGQLRAQDATTSAGGGGGGQPYSLSCGSNALAGVQGTYADDGIGFFVTKLQGLCVAVNTDGSWLGSPTPTSGFAGQNRGTAVSAVCPSGWAVSGLTGEGGWYVDRFWIYCTPLSAFGHTSGSPTMQQSVIGDQPLVHQSFFGPFYCPGAKPAKGLVGRAQDWIDQVALVCNYPSVPPPSVAFITVPTPTVVGGNPVNGSLGLNVAAPAGGMAVALQRQLLASDVAKIPASPFVANPVPVPGGQTTASFVFNTLPVATPVGVTLGASTPAGLVTRAFSIVPPSLTALSVSPFRASPGTSVTGAITLNGAAPTGGVTLTLTSSVPATATVPANVAVPQGQSSVTFPVTVAAGRSAACTLISASGGYAAGGATPLRQLSLPVVVPASSAFTLSAAGTNGSISVLAVVVSPETFLLTSSNPVLAGVPARVTVQPGSLSAVFPISLAASSGAGCFVVTAVDPKGNSNAMVFELLGGGIKRIG